MANLTVMLEVCGAMVVAARPTFILAVKGALGKWYKGEAGIRDDLRESKSHNCPT